MCQRAAFLYVTCDGISLVAFVFCSTTCHFIVYRLPPSIHPSIHPLPPHKCGQYISVLICKRRSFGILFLLFYCLVHIVASISTNTKEFMAALSSLPVSPPSSTSRPEALYQCTHKKREMGGGPAATASQKFKRISLRMTTDVGRSETTMGKGASNSLSRLSTFSFRISLATRFILGYTQHTHRKGGMSGPPITDPAVSALTSGPNQCCAKSFLIALRMHPL